MAANIIDFETLAKGRDAAPMPEPTHVGALAGLSEQERAQAVDAYVALTSPASMPRGTMRKPPARSLEEQLALRTKDELLEYARNLNLSGVSKLRKAKLAGLLAEAIPASIALLEGLLTMRPDRDFEAARDAWKKGGAVTYAHDDRDLPHPLPMVSMLFDHGGALHYVIPDEAMAALGRVDWESVGRTRALQTSVYSCASACAEFYGVIEVSELLDMIFEWHPDEDEIDIEAAFDLAVAMSSFFLNGFDMWLDDEEETAYLTGSDLSLNGEVFGVEGVPLEEEIELLETCRRAVRASQARFPRKPIPDEAREEGLFAWALKMPCVLALRDFLDRHVPDSEDDYFFADDVLSQVLRASAGTDPARSADVVGLLDEMGLLGSSGTDAELIGLTSAVVDATPRWFCNGWSFREVRELGLGGTRYDAIGRAVKVGRNDPCPCGSGKKYKKCCGR